MKKIIYTSLFLILWIWVVFAADNFFRDWKNWDANVSSSNVANDVWSFSWRLDLEDPRSYNYINNWYRGKLTWWVESDLFWTFITNSEFTLKLKWKYSDPTYTTEIKNKCLNWSNWTSWPEPEIYYISWSIIWNWSLDNSTWENLFWVLSSSWSLSDSYFCSNKKIFLHLFSDTLGNKAVWSWTVSGNDVFLNQEVYVNWIAKINWNIDNWILARHNQDINAIKTSISNNAILKENLNRNVYRVYNTYLNSSANKASWDTISNFNNDYSTEYYYVYNYSWNTENIDFKWVTYINKWKKLVIKSSSSDNIINVKWLNTVIVQWWNIYIKSDIKNWNDNKDLLILVAKRDKNTKNWWNIYIDPWVTNIDAVLIADWSLISMWWGKIQSVKDSNQVNSLRKQLLIYGKVMSSNNVWKDYIPYWADLYSWWWQTMDWNIYDLWNLRSFSLNYWDSWKKCQDADKLAPIDWKWDFILNAWAWRRNCYLSDPVNNWLRWSNKINPLIIENNLHVHLLDPFILRK